MWNVKISRVLEGIQCNSPEYIDMFTGVLLNDDSLNKRKEIEFQT